jgi:rhamnogalacturonyl hydrolase YesR
MKSYLRFAAAPLAMAIAALPAQASAEHGGDHAEAAAPCAMISSASPASALMVPAKASPLEIGCAVANWQLEANNDMSYIDFRYPQSAYTRGWVKATFFVGLDRFAEATNDKHLLARVRQYAFDAGMELGEREWHGDDQTVAAVYASVARRDNNPELMSKTMEEFDHIIDQNYTMSLEFIEPEDGHTEGTCQRRWCWADAIFMAPPAWALTTKISGDNKYLDYAAKETRAVIEYLQDPKTGLLFRDSRYFELKTPSGKPVFWSRGNGWVFAGLARFIEAMPADHPERPLMVKTFKTLADSLVSIQRADGYWPTSLMDADYLTNPETSGTAFFGFGLAWGLNNGLLKGAKYETARDKAWDAMRGSISDSGKVGWVQQIGKDPQLTDKDSTQLYAVGGTLLFASEMLD